MNPAIPSEGDGDRGPRVGARRGPSEPRLGLRVLARLLGGNYGRVAGGSDPMPEEQRVEVGEVTLVVLRWLGPSPRLVLLHGLNNNAWIWARVACLLRPGREVVAVSLRGHGGSSAPERGYSLPETTADLMALLDRIAPGEPVDLVGHSWGGKVACHLAATAPERVRSLVLADPVPPQGLNRILRSFPWLVAASLRNERGPFRSRRAWERAAGSVLYLLTRDAIDARIWEESFWEALDGTWRHCLPESAFLEILERTLAEDLTPLLPRILCPVLFLRPTFSVGFLPGEIGPLRAALPRMVVHRIAGDHTFIHTNSIDTARAIRPFLESAG